MLSSSGRERAEDWPETAFEWVDSCPFCDSCNSRVEWPDTRDLTFGSAPSTYPMARCQACGTLFLRKRPNTSFIGRAYTNYFTHLSSERDSSSLLSPAGLYIRRSIGTGYVKRRFRGDRSLSSRVATLVMSRWKAKQRWIDYHFRFLPGRPGTLLDFGCGNGSFLRQAESLGWHAVGVDFDPAAVASARKSGLNAVHVEEFDLSRIAGRFDAVTLSHVIEHVPDPKHTLAAIHNALKQNGMIYVECPNADAVGYHVFGQYWRGLEVPRHFAIPTRAALADALERAGFENLRFVHFPERFDHLFVESAVIEQRQTGRMRNLAACRTEWKDRLGLLEYGEFLTVTACS